jgi:hypothetical protein
VPTLQDIPIELKAEQVIASQGKRQIQPALIQGAKEAISLGQTLWRPAAIYDWFDVRAVKDKEVYVAHSTEQNRKAVLHVGPKADLLSPAARVLISVGTIGPFLEQQVHELQIARNHLKAYLLDSTGVVALGAVGEAVRCLAEEKAAELGWGVSPSLSPGSLVGWPLQGQQDLCSLLPLDTIGVQLNSHSVLIPHKSASGLIGLGPGYDSGRVGSVCKYCALSKTCWRRRDDPS